METEKGKESPYSLVHCPDAQRPGAEYLIQVSSMQNSSPTTWVIMCHLHRKIGLEMELILDPRQRNADVCTRPKAHARSELCACYHHQSLHKVSIHYICFSVKDRSSLTELEQQTDSVSHPWIMNEQKSLPIAAFTFSPGQQHTYVRQFPRISLEWL